jgi:hypothetical protein
MNIFRILKIDDEYSLKQYPLDELRLDPRAVPVRCYHYSTGWSISTSYTMLNILSMYT